MCSLNSAELFGVGQNIKQQIPAPCVQNSLSYFHHIHSDYHNTFPICVPWPDEGLCKIWCKFAHGWRSGGSLITVNGIEWGNLQIFFKTHLLSTSPCPSCFELQTQLQLLKSQKNSNYWACIKFLKIFYCSNHHSFSFKNFRPCRDFIMGVYCVS